MFVTREVRLIRTTHPALPWLAGWLAVRDAVSAIYEFGAYGTVLSLVWMRVMTV